MARTPPRISLDTLHDNWVRFHDWARRFEDDDPYSPETVRKALRWWICCPSHTRNVHDALAHYGLRVPGDKRALHEQRVQCAVSALNCLYRRASAVLSEFARTHGLDSAPFAPGVDSESVDVAAVAERVSLALNRDAGGGVPPLPESVSSLAYQALMRLAVAFPQRVMISDLAADLGARRSTLAEDVKKLETRNLVCRPDGERSGLAITRDGLHFLRPDDLPAHFRAARR
jgi:hypothetical protein